MGPGGMGAGGVAAAFERDRPAMGMSPRDLPPRDQSRDMPRDPRDFPSRDPRDDRMMPPPPNRPMGPGTQPPAWPDAPPGRPPQGGGFPVPERPGPERPGPPPAERPGFGPGQTYGGSDEPTFAGFEPGRRARPDMTSEMRMPDRNQPGPSAGMPPAPAGPSQGQGMSQSMGMVPSGEVQRIDQLRRTFQLRRFGSGYDRAEVDRLFEGVVNAMSGRSTMPLDESELDPHQFNLVPGGYFESEVDQALREVRDIIRRR
jgi:hypothetical protein